MHACARTASISMILAASVGLVGCASMDELKATMSKMVKQAGAEVPDSTGSILATKTPTEEANRASAEKGPPERKVQEPHTVKLPNNPLVSDPVMPQGPPAQSAPPQSAPSQLPTPWPEAPSPESFSR